MKVLFSANIPSPYRTEFFNELGKLCDLTVCYERRSASDRDVKWVGKAAQNYQEVYLDLKPVGPDKSRGSALRNYIAAHHADYLIMTNYVSPACMEAILYCRLKKIPYWVEYDGGFNKKDSFLNRIMKKTLICRAEGHLTTSEEHIAYLMSLGIPAERIFKYPFTSLTEKDLEDNYRITDMEKKLQKQELGITERKMILSVGQMIPRKGFDVLLQAVSNLPRDIGIYIVGGSPYEDLQKLKDSLGLENVHFIEFKTKKRLREYYMASDLFVLPTREDIWGLVINEAMSFGLPIITTRKCIAGTELITDGENGYLLEAGEIQQTTEKIRILMESDSKRLLMGNKCRDKIRRYTIERMAQRHIEVLQSH